MYIDPCKSQDYRNYQEGQGGGLSLCNSVRNVKYHVGFTRRKAYKVAGLQNGKTMEFPCCDFLLSESFSLSYRSHENTVSEEERGAIG